MAGEAAVRLQNFCDLNGVGSPVYETILKGKLYVSTCKCDGAEDGHGSGSTKFKAENEAAKPVLAELTLARSHEYDIMSKSTNCDKHRDFTLEFSESYNNPFSGLWYCTCKCSFDKDTHIGSGETECEAKKNAAKLVHFRVPWYPVDEKVVLGEILEDGPG